MSFNKGGRPTKSLVEKRRDTISVKLNTKEHISLKTKASLAGISRSEYIRKCLSETAIYPLLTPEINDYIRKLSGIENIEKLLKL